MTDKEFDPDQAIQRALSRISDLVYPMNDLARAMILGEEEPILETDAAELARRIAREEMDNARKEQGFDVGGY
jgi:hypothetical protein